MKDCKKINNRFFLYFQNVLASKEKRIIETHIKTCKKCRQEFLRIQKLLKMPEEKAPSDNFELILKKGKEIKQKKFMLNLHKLNLLQRVLKVVKMKPRLIIFSGIFGFIIVFSLLLHNLKKMDSNYLYIIHSSGNVKINNKIICSKSSYKYNLKDIVDIEVNKGQCLLQIDNNKQVLLSEGTHISINSSSEIKIDLKKGLLLGRVIKKPEEKNLILKTQKSIFKIIGTLYSLKKELNHTEFSVKKGAVKYISENHSLIITNNQKLKIYKDSFKIKELSENDNILFNRIENNVLIKDFKKYQKVYIDIVPADSDIYYNNKYLGQSPAFLIIRKSSHNEFLVQNKDYQTHSFVITNIMSIQEINLIKKEDTRKKKIILSDDKWIGDTDKGKISIKYNTELQEKKCAVADYKFSNGSWIQLFQDIKINIKNIKYLSFDYINMNPLENQLVVGVIDVDGNVFSNNINQEIQYGTWKKITVNINNLLYRGQGKKLLHKEMIKKIFITLDVKEGGNGLLGITDVELKE